MSLNEEEIRLFWTRGYLVKPGLVAPEVVQDIRREIEGLESELANGAPADVVVGWEDPPSTPPRLQQVLNADLVSPAIDGLVAEEALLDPASALIGPDVGLFQAKVLFKAARVGGELPWHQDFAYWRDLADAPLQINCMIYLE